MRGPNNTSSLLRFWYAGGTPSAIHDDRPTGLMVFSSCTAATPPTIPIAGGAQQSLCPDSFAQQACDLHLDATWMSQRETIFSFRENSEWRLSRRRCESSADKRF